MTMGRHSRILVGTYGFPLLPFQLRLSVQEARTHFHVIGTSGSGKSRFLAGLFLLLLKSGLSAGRS